MLCFVADDGDRDDEIQQPVEPSGSAPEQEQALVYLSFTRSLPCGIDNPRGEPLVLADLVDFDLCWAFDLVDPWRNQYELNCYDYDRVRAELIEADDVKADRYWPRELYSAYLDFKSKHDG